MKAIFLVPKDYKLTGGMYMPINHYVDYFNRNGMIVDEIIELPYHKDNTCKGISERLHSKLSEEKYNIVGFTLNICYMMLRDFQLHKNSNCDCTCFLVDSMSLNMDSVIRNESIGKEYIEHILKFFLYELKEKYCLRNCNKIVYVSSVDKQYVLKRFNRDILGDVFVVPNGIDLPNEVSDKLVRNENDIPTLGTLTGFSQETLNNNLYPFLYSIFPQIIKEFPDIRFVIAGRGASVEVEEKLSHLDNVDYIGEVEDLHDFYDKVDIVVTTVKKDCGLINRVLEAWAYRRLNIGFSKNFAAFEYAENGVHYLSADNEGEFVSAVEYAIKYPDKARIIRDNGYDLVKNKYSWGKSGEVFLDIIENK
ncbi:glycosyltransferase [Butyrivibrio sp. X503]|uniref:glycosyltransferase family 4 protein n=1 Tax=Butyrivibrio sp. X503 TaxID=2364878 RepID=UPI000EAA6B8E|nr:glycosyltransferase family 4 protein [Butyrivibrio sp. X503]RKM54468.1 glycosyltransferase [Butyrivibrio sp. X503]